MTTKSTNSRHLSGGAWTSDDPASPKDPQLHSPPTLRVVKVMDQLARQPTRHLSLTEIASGAGINPTTCLAVLTELVRAGWLIRRPADKTYTLGAAVVKLGTAAEASHPRLRYARLALDELHRAYNVGCGLVGVSGSQIEILDYVGDPGDSGRRGVPFAAPFSPIFVAWADDEEVEAWLRASGNPVDEGDHAWFAKVFSSIRQRRYGVDRLNDTVVRLRQLLVDMAGDPLTEWIQPNVQSLLHQLGNRAQLVDELRPGKEFPVNVLYSPIFDEDARPILNVSIHLVRNISYEELSSIADHLVSLTTEITEKTGGRFPEAHSPRDP